MKKLYTLIVLVASVGIGITAYWASTSGSIEVSDEKITISPASYTIKMNASSVYTKDITIGTPSTSDIDIDIKVLPADDLTVDKWGTKFIAFAEQSDVTINSSSSAKVTVIHFSEETGNYKVKIIAAK